MKAYQRYGRIAGIWLAAFCGGFVLRFFYPAIGLPLYLSAIAAPFYFVYASYKSGNRSDLLASIAFLTVILGVGTWLKTSSDQRKRQLAQEKEAEQAEMIARTFLPFSASELASILHPIPLASLQSRESVGVGSGGFDIVEYAPGEVSRLDLSGHDGRVEKLELTLGQGYDQTTNEDQIAIGRKLATALGVAEWYDAHVKAVNWNRPVSSVSGGKGVSIALTFQQSPEKAIVFTLTKSRFETAQKMQEVVSSNISLRIEDQLNALLKRINAIPGMGSTVRGVAIVNYNVETKKGTLEVKVRYTIWKRLDESSKILFMRKILDIWNEVRGSSAGTFTLTILDDEDSGRVLGGSRDGGKFYAK